MEEKRVAKMKALIVATAEIEKSTLPILNQCIEDMIKGASIVNFQQVIYQLQYSLFEVSRE